MITCETCTHYRRDPINPQAGIGSCAKQHLPRYPAQKHYCRDHEKAEEARTSE